MKKAMKNKMRLAAAQAVLAAATLAALNFETPAQSSGGQFTVTQSVVANGGGESSAPEFSVVGTTAQTIAGPGASSAAFRVKSGFWTSTLAPTAASAAIGGRVLTADGRGIRNALVTLTDQSGAIRHAVTGTFGFYRFEDLPVGQVYILTVTSRRFQFPEPTRVVTLQDSIENLDFTAQREN